MNLYRPATFHSDSIVRPPCPKCGAKMQLVRIEPHSSVQNVGTGKARPLESRGESGTCAGTFGAGAFLNLPAAGGRTQPDDVSLRESALTKPSVQHDHYVFSSAASQIAILGAALLAVLIMAWLYLGCSMATPKRVVCGVLPRKRTLPYQTVGGDGMETTGKIVEAYVRYVKRWDQTR